MKKVVAIIMAALMLASLCALSACKESAESVDENNTDHEEVIDQVESNIEAPVTKYWGKSVPELLEEGTVPLVAVSMPDFSDEVIDNIAKGLEEKFGEVGIDILRLSAEGVTTNQIDQIENAVTMGVVAIIIGSMEPEALVTCNQNATEQGVILTVLGDIPESHEVNGGVAVDYAALGEAEGAMVIEYLNQYYPDAADGSIKVANGVNVTYVTTKLCSDAWTAILEADPRVSIVYTEYEVSSVDAGYNFAENALMYDSEIRLFTLMHDVAAIGVNNYVIANYSDKIAEFAVFANGGNTQVEELVEQSKIGESCLVGTIQYGGEDPAQGLFDSTYKLLMGEEVSPYFVFEPYWATTAFGFTTEG